MRRKKYGRWIFGFLVIGACAGAVYYSRGQIGNQTETEATAQQAYREANVAYGSVVYGITESGSVSFGTTTQEIELPQAVQSSSGSSSSGSSDSSSAESGDMSFSGGGGGEMAGAGGFSGMEGMQGDSQMGMSTGTSSSGQTSSSQDGGLEVEEVYVSVGQEIQEGDAILKLSEESVEDYRAKLEQAVEDAKLQVEQEEINLESSRAEAQYTYDMNIAEGETAQETYDATIASLESDVAKLEEELEEAAQEVEEYEEELAAGSDVEDELEEAEAAYSEVEADLQIAKNNLTTQSIEAKQTYENAVTNYTYAQQLYDIATNGLEDGLNEAKETLEEAEAALEEFNLLMQDGTITAQYGGTVTEVGYSEGDTVSDGGTVITLSDSQEATMSVMVAQEDVSQISIGDQAQVEMTAYANETFDAQVTSIDSSTSMGSSAVSYEVTVQFTGDVGRLYSGMTGDVTFPVETAENVLYVPNRAVSQEGTRSYVKVLEEDGSITETEVKTGFSNGTEVEIVSGLTEGQTVLIESQVNE